MSRAQIRIILEEFCRHKMYVSNDVVGSASKMTRELWYLPRAERDGYPEVHPFESEYDTHYVSK